MSNQWLSILSEDYPRATWTNDRNQFYQPDIEMSEEFVTDCVIWSAFSESNNTVSLKDVKYLEKIYQIQNNLYPYTVEEVKGWKHSLSELGLQGQYQQMKIDLLAKRIIEMQTISGSTRRVR